jgi:hypothetical protein
MLRHQTTVTLLEVRVLQLTKVLLYLQHNASYMPQTNKQTNKTSRQSDRRLSAKLVLTFAD